MYVRQTIELRVLLLLFFTLGINNPERFLKLSYSMQKAGVDVSPSGQSCYVAE